MMSEYDLTYVFEADGVVAFYEGQKVASGTTLAAAEKTAVEYLDHMTKQRKQHDYDQNRRSATHITSPNGLKGQILSRVPTVWGEKVTVRFENGRIASLDTHANDQLVYSNERTAALQALSATQRLASIVEASFDHDKASLRQRLADLAEVRSEIHAMISEGASYAEEVELDRLAIQAHNEQIEIREALAHLEAVDSAVDYEPREYRVASQADMGRQAGNNWLDVVAAQMIEESEGQDFDKLLGEGPAIFTASLSTGTLQYEDGVAEMAREFITAKTAGYRGDDVEGYRDSFVARTEMARVAEIAERAEKDQPATEASEGETTELPDEALFV